MLGQASVACLRIPLSRPWRADLKKARCRDQTVAPLGTRRVAVPVSADIDEHPHRSRARLRHRGADWFRFGKPLPVQGPVNPSSLHTRKVAASSQYRPSPRTALATGLRGRHAAWLSRTSR